MTAAKTTTVVEKTVRTTGPCRHFPCDRAYPGRVHSVPDSGIVQHRQNWLYEPNLLQVGMVCFEDVAHGEAPGEWQVYIQIDHLNPPAMILLPNDDAGGRDIGERMASALVTSIVQMERANAARRAADR